MGYFARKTDRFRPLMLALIAGCLAACSIDVPTPVIVQKDTTIPFPCQNRPCGCKNADQCWSSCCCFSDSEKVAWAKANNVTLPDWFYEKMAANPEPVAKQKSGCCCCCKSKVASTQPSECNEAPVVKPTKVEVRLSLRQQKGCQGQSDYLLKNLIYLPLEVPGSIPDEEFPLYPQPALFLLPVVLDMPTPPPRP